MTEPLPFKQRLKELQHRCRYAKKDATNSFHKYKYVSEAKIKALVGKHMHDLDMLIADVRMDYSERTTAQDAVVRVTITIEDLHSKSHIILQGVGGAMDKKGDKATMKAVAAAVKYALTTGNLTATGDDPEADDSADADW